MTVWLVRHGQSDWNALGIRHRRENRPLTTRGIWDADSAAMTLAVNKTAKVVTSPLLRAYGTACVIAHHLELDAPIIALALAERRYGQTSEDAAKVAAEYLSSLDGLIVAVTHAGIIKGLTGVDRTPPNGSVVEWKP